jgi:hypothetical protein
MILAPGMRCSSGRSARRSPGCSAMTPSAGFHVNESYEQLATAYAEAAAGRIPSVPPCEIYCHSLTDPSILGADERAAGVQTLTLFGLHMPARLFEGRNDVARRRLCGRHCPLWIVCWRNRPRTACGAAVSRASPATMPPWPCSPVADTARALPPSISGEQLQAVVAGALDVEPRFRQHLDELLHSGRFAA